MDTKQFGDMSYVWDNDNKRLLHSLSSELRDKYHHAEKCDIKYDVIYEILDYYRHIGDAAFQIEYNSLLNKLKIINDYHKLREVIVNNPKKFNVVGTSSTRPLTWLHDVEQEMIIDLIEKHVSLFISELSCK